MGLVLTLYLRDMGSIPAHSTKGSEGCISGDRISILGVEYGMEYVVRAKDPALGPVRSFSADRKRRKNRN